MDFAVETIRCISVSLPALHPMADSSAAMIVPSFQLNFGGRAHSAKVIPPNEQASFDDDE